MKTTLEQKRDNFLSKFIENCVFNGWNEANIAESSEQLGLETGEFMVLYPGGLEELTISFANDVEMDFKQQSQILEVDKLKIREKARALMMLKIKLYLSKLGGIEGFKKFVSYFFNPLNVSSAVKGVYTFASDSWYIMGDNSTDFSYYTKRASFGVIYSKAVIYACNDESERLKNTEKFIERRIDELMKIGKLKQKFNGLAEKLKFNFV